MAKPIQIPFDENGHPLTYPDWGAKWVDNYEFQDTLTYSGFSRGRSAAHMLFVDSRGMEYSMFLKDFDTLLKTKGLDGNKITGTFTFCKKGQNYGLKLVS